MNPRTSAPVDETSPKGLNTTLWAVQGLLSFLFVGTAVWKLLTPVPALSRMIPWAGEVSPVFLYFTAMADLAGGLGILLPSLTRIRPALAVLAAVGCVALQVCAIVFHFSRGEAMNTPFNFLLIVLSLFVAWGRWRVPILSRV